MGKHRTAQQDAIFVAFMERHPVIAKNYMKGDKQAAEAAWRRLSKELNSVGPPVKEANEWKRVWKDWKSCIRKKITNNRLEDSQASGKGALYQDTLTPLEDAVAVICDLYEVADSVAEARPKHSASLPNNGECTAPKPPSITYLNKFSRKEEGEEEEQEDQEEQDDEEDDEECGNPIRVPPIGGANACNSTRTSSPQTTPKKRKLDEDTIALGLVEIAKELRDLNRQTRLNAQRTEASLEACLALGSQVSDLLQQNLKERKRLNVIMEKFVLKMESTE
ncbi:hypothetical protein KR018_008689 [Drosophila ironensis]|nr:hypothetical protein KR018_008689 [Drosophila ironensis]